MKNLLLKDLWIITVELPHNRLWDLATALVKLTSDENVHKMQWDATKRLFCIIVAVRRSGTRWARARGRSWVSPCRTTASSGEENKRTCWHHEASQKINQIKSACHLCYYFSQSKQTLNISDHFCRMMKGKLNSCAVDIKSLHPPPRSNA